MATLEELINSMYDMVQDAKNMPLSSDKCVLERDRLLDMLDELRAQLPADIKMAQDIVEKRNELIAAGKREAETLRKKAEDAARQMISETEIVVAARKRAKEIVGNAEIQARELRRVANESRKHWAARWTACARRACSSNPWRKTDAPKLCKNRKI